MPGILRQPGLLLVVGLFTLAPPHHQATRLSAAEPPPLDQEDSVGQLARGTLTPASLPPGEPRPFRFLADGPGVLTLAWTEPSDAPAPTLTGPGGQAIELKNGKQHGQRAPFVRSHIVPLIDAGSYTLTLQSEQASATRIGCAWMPFEPLARGGDHAGDRTAPNGLATRRDWVDGLEPLPIGSVGEARNGSGIPRSYKHTAAWPGLLTLVVRAKPNETGHPTDVTLQVNDDRGQSLTNGVIDINVGGDKGAEQLTVGIQRAASVQAIIHPIGGGAYHYAASWITVDDLAAEPGG